MTCKTPSPADARYVGFPATRSATTDGYSDGIDELEARGVGSVASVVYVGVTVES